MAKYLEKSWLADLGGYTRADRKSGIYRAYLPDPLVGRTFFLDGETTAEIDDAAQAIAELDRKARVLRDTEALARLLLRAESVASSRIEGLEMGARKLLRAELQRSEGAPEPFDVTASEIMGNIDAMAHVVSAIHSDKPIHLEDLLLVHKKLMRGTSQQDLGGVLRNRQNWIGGSNFHPMQARFVPPPPEYVKGLLEDLVHFCNQNNLPPVAQAAIAHAQFETIHPFADGNGRTGRALIHMVLRKRSLVSRITPPISLVLATRSKEYIAGLEATRHAGSSNSSSAQKGLQVWIATFSNGCKHAVENSINFEKKMDAIQVDWRSRLGKIRANSAAEVLLGACLASPVMTVKSASSYINRSFLRTNEAIARFVDAKILKQSFLGKRRNRIFEAQDSLDAFLDFERQMASPAGNTKITAPVRPVPRRKV